MQKASIKHMLSFIFLVVLGTYIVFGTILFLFQSHFVYFPDPEIVATPHNIGLHYESILFHSEDGLELSGWFVPAREPRGVVLFCHGNGGNISHRLQSLEIFHKLNVSTFIFDYRGYGNSQGKPSETGTYLDAKAAWDYLMQRRGVPSESIVVYGESLGGAVASWLAKEVKPAGLVLASSFTSIPDMAVKAYPIFPVRLMSRFHYSTCDYLRKVDCPILVIHSRDDEIVPFSHGYRLYEAAKPPKELLEIRGDHNSGFLVSQDIYTRGLDLFLSNHFKVKAAE